jgi:3-dehydroquinate synthase
LSKPQSLSVDLGDRSYPIVIGNGLLANFDLESEISGGDVLLVSNETVGPLYLDRVKERLGNKTVSSIELPDGEQFKTLDTAQLVIDELVSMGANRDTTLIALGGGVVGDITGFAAACYMRGVSFIQIPTTLLSQVDSSVGGKTGVNHEGGKNLIGAFHQPKLVLIDTDTINTLPDRELSAGMAEVIKHGAIADIEYFAWLEENVGDILAREPDALAHTIRRSCEIKAQVVSEDEHERGKRALLNFGHTFGHAIENSMGYGEWLHGEAVSAGMLMAAMLGNLPEEQWSRLKALLHAANLPGHAPAVGSDKLRAAMALDKKVTNKSLRFVLLHSLGEAYITTEYSEDSLNDILAGADG